MTSWKAAESRVGVWYGAKGIKNSGRVPLSGGGSGVTRADAPHSTIFIETKRDKSYHNVIKLYRKLKPKDSNFVLSLPKTFDGKIISKISDIVCIHNDNFFNIAKFLSQKKEIMSIPWQGNYPRALTLYEQSMSIKNSTFMDKNKKVVTVNLIYHGHSGFYIVININDVIECSNLILNERIDRETIIKEEKSWAVDVAAVEKIQ